MTTTDLLSRMRIMILRPAAAAGMVARAAVAVIAAVTACGGERAVRGGGAGGEPPLRAEFAGFPPDVEVVAWSPDESVLVVRHSKRCATMLPQPGFTAGSMRCVMIAEALHIADGRRVRLTDGMVDVPVVSGPARFAPSGRALIVRSLDGVPFAPATALPAASFVGFDEWIDLDSGARRRLSPPTQRGVVIRGSAVLDGGDVWLVRTSGQAESEPLSLFRLSTGTYTRLPDGATGAQWNTAVSDDGRVWYWIAPAGGLWTGGLDRAPQLVATRVNAFIPNRDLSRAIVWVGDPPAPGTGPIAGDRGVVTLPDFAPVEVPDDDDCEFIEFDRSGRHLVCTIKPEDENIRTRRMMLWNTIRSRWEPPTAYAISISTLHEGRTIFYVTRSGLVCITAADAGDPMCRFDTTTFDLFAAAARSPTADLTVNCAPGAGMLPARCSLLGLNTVHTKAVVPADYSPTRWTALMFDASGDVVRGFVRWMPGGGRTSESSALWAWHIPRDSARWVWGGSAAPTDCTPRGRCLWRADRRWDETWMLLNANAAPEAILRRRSLPHGSQSSALLGEARIAYTARDGRIGIEPVAEFGEVVPSEDVPAEGGRPSLPGMP